MNAHQSKPTWTAEGFDADFEREARRKRQRRFESRLRGPAPPLKGSPRLAQAEQRCRTKYDARKAITEANPYFADKIARGAYTFSTYSLWIEWQAKAGDPDARLVWRAANEDWLKAAHRQRAKDLKAAKSRRLQFGFQWSGGSIAGNSSYARDGFTYAGLVSEEHLLLRLFVTRIPRRKNLRTGHTKAESNRARSKLLALDHAYIETNSTMRGVLRVELDKDFPNWDTLGEAIAAAGAPLPNLAVGFVNQGGRVRRPHLIWLIEAPVPFTPKARKPHQSLFIAVLKALTVTLLPIGADPGGLTNPHRHKNPLSPLWIHRILADEPYTLDTLRKCLADACPVEEASKRLKAAGHRERLSGGSHGVRRDHPDLAIAAESNQMFGTLSLLARGRIGWHRDEGRGSREELVMELEEQALRLAPWMGPARSAAYRIHRMAQKITAWTWDNWRDRKPLRLTPAQCQALRAEAGRKTAAARSSATLEHLLGLARRLRTSGQTVTQAALSRVATTEASPEVRTGCSVRTVQIYWKAIQAALALDQRDETQEEEG